MHIFWTKLEIVTPKAIALLAGMFSNPARHVHEPESRSLCSNQSTGYWIKMICAG